MGRRFSIIFSKNIGEVNHRRMVKMSLETKEVEVEWNKTTKSYLIPKGYTQPLVGNQIIVKIEDMPKGAHVEVQVKCDYCGKVVPKNYYDYNNQRKNSIVKKDACIKCAHLKRNESVEIHEQLNIPFEKRQKSNSNQRLSLEFIQQVFKNKNCTLITDFYKNNKQDLEYICNIHTDKGVQHIDGQYVSSSFICFIW
jgi:hypothetical protein